MPQYTGAQPDEVFLGNTETGIPDHLGSIPSIRLGDVALDIEGKRLPPKYRPMFIKHGPDHEQHERIMMARFSAWRRGC